MAKIFLPSHIWLRFFCRAGPPRKSHAIFGGDKSIYGEAERPNSSNLDVRDGSPQQVEETLDFFAEPVPPENRMRFSGGTRAYMAR